MQILSRCFWTPGAIVLLFRVTSAQFSQPIDIEGDGDHVQLTRACSREISQLVRERLEQEVWGPATAQGLNTWPDGCPFNPSLDLLGIGAKRVANKTLSEWDGTCLEDFCEIFGVCHGRAKQHDECDETRIASAKRRCEAAVFTCFPLGGSHVARRLHTHFSQQRCRVLDCKFHGQDIDKSGNRWLLVLVELLLILVVCALAFGVIVTGVELSGEGVIVRLAEKGIVSQGFVRACVRAKGGMRETLGLLRTKGF